jgi:hypothetical protein
MIGRDWEMIGCDCIAGPACYAGFTVAQGLQRRQTKAH